MLCESCKERDATVHLTQVIDGTIKKLHLCEECAAKSGFNAQSPLSITDILLGMGMESGMGVEDKAEPAAKRKADLYCPRCHMRREEFKKSGRFGCGTCYETFAKDLPPLLKAMQRSDHHTGKIPRGASAQIRAIAELAALERQMEQAVASENFEEAAVLRDKINECRKQISAEGAGKKQ